MLRYERLQLALMMALHLLWGVVLWFSISKYGLGISTDAVHLLFGAQNLAAGNGLTTYDGSFLPSWPPLYPALIALVLVGADVHVLTAATIVQAVAFLGLGISLSLLFLRMFSGRLLPAAAALLLTQAGEVVLAAAGTVGSDYVHLFLAVLAVLLTARYIESESRAAFIGLAVVLMLATLQRYLGLAATGTAIAAIFLLGRRSWRNRLTDALVLGLTALPMLAWLAFTSPLYTMRGPITFGENFSWFSRSVLEWFAGAIERKTDLTLATTLLWLAVLMLAAAALVLARRGGRGQETPDRRDGSNRDARPYVTVLLLYGLFYLVALFGSASISYFNKLGGRFILPLFIPITALPIIVTDGLVQAARAAHRRTLAYLLTALGGLTVVLLGAALLHSTYPFVMTSHAQGVTSGDNSFNNERWHENPAILYWERHRPTGEYLIFSNEQDGVAFFTQHAVHSAPRRISGPYATDVMSVADFQDELFGSGLDVYLIWIEPNSHDYYYAPNRLDEIATVETLFGDKLGSVYRLRPKGKD